MTLVLEAAPWSRTERDGLKESGWKAAGIGAVSMIVVLLVVVVVLSVTGVEVPE